MKIHLTLPNSPNTLTYEGTETELQDELSTAFPGFNADMPLSKMLTSLQRARYGLRVTDVRPSDYEPDMSDLYTPNHQNLKEVQYDPYAEDEDPWHRSRSSYRDIGKV